MSTIITQHTDRILDPETGEIREVITHRQKKSRIDQTDEYVKVSRALLVIFARYDIPLSTLPALLVLAQRMDYKTNCFAWLKPDKTAVAAILGVDPRRAKAIVSDLCKRGVVRQICPGRYQICPYIVSCGTVAETRDLQHEWDQTEPIISGNGILYALE